MAPRIRIAGIAGITSGILLVGELTFFMISGWTPEVFADPAAALSFLEASGVHLRWAVAFGGLNLAALTIFFAGLAARLHARTPTRASATLYLGLIGIAGHALVPLALWVGIPALLELRALDSAAAQGSWGGFNILLDGAQAVGGLFLGLAMTAAGWAIASGGALSKGAGWAGLGAGAATLLGLLAPDTPVSGLAMAAFMPSLLLSIVFRIWAGVSLTRSDEESVRAHRPAAHPVAEG